MSSPDRRNLFHFDSQVHIWLPESEDRRWPGGHGGGHHRPASVSDDEVLALMDAAGVAAAVLVPPSFEGDRNEYAFAAAARHPDRFAVQARFDFNQRGAADEIREAFAQHRGVRGIRVTFNGDAATWLLDGTLDWLWPFAQQERIALSLFLWPADAKRDTGQLAALDAIATKHPDLRLGLDRHGVGAWAGPDDLLTEMNQLSAVAKRPNISVKVSALPNIVRGAYSVDLVRQVMTPMIDWFGPERLFWGTDITGSPISYRENIDTMLEALGDYSDADVALIMGGALRKWLGWPAE